MGHVEGTRMALIRALPFDMPTEEVIKVLSKRGLVTTKSQVYKARTIMRVEAAEAGAPMPSRHAVMPHTRKKTWSRQRRPDSVTWQIEALPLSMDVREVIDHLAKKGVTATKQNVWQARYAMKKRVNAQEQAKGGDAGEPVFLPPPVSYGTTQRRARRLPQKLSELSALQQRIAALTQVAAAIEGLDEESVSWVFDTLMTALTKPRKALDRTIRESYGSSGGTSNGHND